MAAEGGGGGGGSERVRGTESCRELEKLLCGDDHLPSSTTSSTSSKPAGLTVYTVVGTE